MIDTVSLHRFSQKLAALSDNPGFARAKRIAAWFFVAAMVVYLGLRLTHIGWLEIWRARPRSALFYVFLFAAYFTLPLADTLIYRRLWRTDYWRTLPVFLRKRIYNFAFVGYSGEVFLLMWARKKLKLADKDIIHAIKDTNILSAVVSTYITAALIIYVIYTIGFEHAYDFEVGPFLYWTLATFLFAALIPFSLMFRQKLLRFTIGMAAFVFSVHLIRFLINQALQLGQWHFAMPDVSMETLISLLAIQMIIGRVPFIPNRDLLFIGVGIDLSHSLMLSQTTVASLLLTTSAIQQAMHLVVYFLTSFIQTGRGAEKTS